MESVTTAAPQARTCTMESFGVWGDIRPNVAKSVRWRLPRNAG